MNTNKTDRTLDAYDNLLIRLFKNSKLRHSQRFFYYVKRIWGLRTAMDVSYVKNNEYIVYHLIELGFDIGIINQGNLLNLIHEAQPSEMFRFVARQQKPEDFKEYYDCWLMALSSFYALTEVKKLPGFEKSARWKKMG